jgi:peptidoglycan hydrolase CwlO-like protein
MPHRLRYILPVVAFLIFAGWVYSDDIPKPDLAAAIQNLQNTLSQLQSQIKDLQSSVKDLAREAREAKKQKTLTASARPAGSAAGTESAARNGASEWQRAQEAYERGRR